jgi:hypothetical protein
VDALLELVDVLLKMDRHESQVSLARLERAQLLNSFRKKFELLLDVVDGTHGLQPPLIKGADDGGGD